ncbi:hypothetical protein CMO93_04110 [Candidatus Woesearchaeota archaeon]|nr:hypothetical protein [Candidatus Woesearchaeota archaeon]|tara:strand:+ start:1846 stop:2100 length:255 start_codon:yes stop_codon:yes gene_type:complete
MGYIEIIGFVAAVLTTTAFVPQAVKSWKTKHTKDVSLGWISILTAGIVLWLVYGILIASFPLIFANLLSFILVLIILILKIKYG